MDSVEFARGVIVDSHRGAAAGGRRSLLLVLGEAASVQLLRPSADDRVSHPSLDDTLR